MGGSLPAHNNRFSAQGLRPGTALRLNLDRGDRVETFATRVEDLDERVLTVSTPIERFHDRPIGRGTAVHALYTHEKRFYGFVTESLGVSVDGDFQYLAPPDAIQSTDRRSAFRLEESLRPHSVYRLLVDPERSDEPGGLVLKCSIIDISEGGVCLSSRHAAVDGEWLGIHIDLPAIGDLKLRMRVAGAEPPPKGQLNHRLHCVFVDLSRLERDRIARYLMKRQLDLRHRGRL